MIQQEMIQSVRAACHADDRVIAALMFGSFSVGEGDEFSDIEFAVFVREDAADEFDQRAWLDAVSSVAAYFLDDFGHHTALFENGIRGEFHFIPMSHVSVVAQWRGHGWFPSLAAGVILDRTGELSHYASALVGGPPDRTSPAAVESVALNLINLILLGGNLLNRGEYARAWALLGRVHENLLKLVRLSERATDHWPTPSRALERDVTGTTYARYVACTADAEPSRLRRAYRDSWTWGRELFESVAAPSGVVLPSAIVGRVDRLLSEKDV